MHAGRTEGSRFRSDSTVRYGEMADRKAELEKKRKKLEELKKAREQKKKEGVDSKVLRSMVAYSSLTQ